MLARLPVPITAIAVHAGSLVIFATATGVPELLSARVVQGLSTGAALGRDRGRHAGHGPRTRHVRQCRGARNGHRDRRDRLRAGGPLPAGPHRLIYLVLIGVLAAQALAITAMREPVSRQRGALASLRPEIIVPRALRGPVPTAVPVLFAVWALAGLYGALGPSLVALVDRLRQRGARRAEPVHAGRIGGRRGRSAAPGRRPDGHADRRRCPDRRRGRDRAGRRPGIRGGLLRGLGDRGHRVRRRFQGSIRTVVPLAAAHERAGLVSLLYVVSYLGLGVPAVLAGFGVVDGGGLVSTTRYYGAALIVLAALALPGLMKSLPGRLTQPCTQVGA